MSWKPPRLEAFKPVSKNEEGRGLRKRRKVVF